jgi:hypothetical protein
MTELNIYKDVGEFKPNTLLDVKREQKNSKGKEESF